MKVAKLMVIIIGSIAFGLSQAAAINLYPTDDIYIDTIFTGQHQPQELYIANDPVEPHVNEIMMKFDLEPYMGADIDQAVLWLYKFYGCSEGFTNAGFYHITQPWDESGWPVDQYVEHGDYGWSSRIFSVMGWNPVDLTDLVATWLIGDIPNYGLVMIGVDGTHLSKVYSKDATNEFKPYLEIPSITGIENEQLLPENFESNAYPNPFNAKITISYSLQTASDINIELFNVLGQRVETLLKLSQPAGRYQISWNAGDNPTGVYFYRITAGDQARYGKILLLK